MLRHGETVWNREGRIQGCLDSPLTERGLSQARRQAQILSSRVRAQCPVYTSPLRRARRTAEIACADFGELHDEPRLAELNMGDWQGLTIDEISATEAGRIAFEQGGYWKFLAPGGERFEDACHRARGVLERLDGPTIVVTHGVTSVLLRLLAQGLDPGQFDDLDVPQGVVFAIEGGKEEIWR